MEKEIIAGVSKDVYDATKMQCGVFVIVLPENGDFSGDIVRHNNLDVIRELQTGKLNGVKVQYAVIDGNGEQIAGDLKTSLDKKIQRVTTRAPKKEPYMVQILESLESNDSYIRFVPGRSNEQINENTADLCAKKKIPWPKNFFNEVGGKPGFYFGPEEGAPEKQ